MDVIEVSTDVGDDGLCVTPCPSHRNSGVAKVADLVVSDEGITGILCEYATTFLIKMAPVSQNIVDHHIARDAVCFSTRLTPKARQFGLTNAT